MFKMYSKQCQLSIIIKAQEIFEMFKQSNFVQLNEFYNVEINFKFQ